MVITALTRNQVCPSKAPWVRIPPAPPFSAVLCELLPEQRFYFTFWLVLYLLGSASEAKSRLVTSASAELSFAV